MLKAFQKEDDASVDRRVALARKYIRGRGLEIGPLHNPLYAPKAHVTYVDRLTVEELRTHYPELGEVPLTPVDRVDDGEKLASFELNSQDFIIANHFIEHAQDPIGTIMRHLDVLRPGGVLYLAVPDKRYSFDRLRPETDFEHLLRDHRDGPEWSFNDHLREFAALVMNVPPDSVEAAVEALKESAYSIHFHVWSHASFEDFVRRLVTDLKLPMTVEALVDNTDPNGELICVIRKNKTSLSSRLARRLLPPLGFKP